MKLQLDFHRYRLAFPPSRWAQGLWLGFALLLLLGPQLYWRVTEINSEKSQKLAIWIDHANHSFTGEAGLPAWQRDFFDAIPPVLERLTLESHASLQQTILRAHERGWVYRDTGLTGILTFHQLGETHRAQALRPLLETALDPSYDYDPQYQAYLSGLTEATARLLDGEAAPLSESDLPDYFAGEDWRFNYLADGERFEVTPELTRTAQRDAHFFFLYGGLSLFGLGVVLWEGLRNRGRGFAGLPSRAFRFPHYWDPLRIALVYLLTIAITSLLSLVLWIGLSFVGITFAWTHVVLIYAITVGLPVTFVSYGHSPGWTGFSRLLGLDTWPRGMTRKIVGGLAASFGLGALLMLLPFYAIEEQIVDSFDLDTIYGGTPAFVAMLVIAVIIAPVGEEIFFRGFLYQSLRFHRWGMPAAIGVSSLAFALIHDYSLMGLISVFLFGAVAAYLFEKTGSLWSSIVMHALFNLILTFDQWLRFSHPIG